MVTFSALLAFCVGNSPITGEFPSQRPVTRSFDVFFDLHLNKRLSKQSWDWNNWPFVRGTSAYRWIPLTKCEQQRNFNVSLLLGTKLEQAEAVDEGCQTGSRFNIWQVQFIDALHQN